MMANYGPACPICGKQHWTVACPEQPTIDGGVLGEKAAEQMATATANILNPQIEKLIAAARLDGERVGYVKALDDARVKFAKLDAPFAITVINQLKSDYLKESENGKQD